MPQQKQNTRPKPRRAQRFGDAVVQTTIRQDYDAVVLLYASADRESRMERLGPYSTPEEALTVGTRRLRALRREFRIGVSADAE